MEEMLEDTLEVDADDDLEEEADAEVDKVLFELTNGKLGLAGTVGTELPVSCLNRLLFHVVLIFSTRPSKNGCRMRRQKEQWKNTVSN